MFFAPAGTSSSPPPPLEEAADLDSAELHPPQRACWPRHRQTLQSRSVPLLLRPAPLHLLETRAPSSGSGGERENENSPAVGTPASSRPPHLGVVAAAKAGTSLSGARGAVTEIAGQPRAPPAPPRAGRGVEILGHQVAVGGAVGLRRDVLGKLGLPLIRLSPQVSCAPVYADFCRKYLEERKVLQGLQVGWEQEVELSSIVIPFLASGFYRIKLGIMTEACIPHYIHLNLQPKPFLKGLLCGNHNQIIQRILLQMPTHACTHTQRFPGPLLGSGK
ncbi:uncharacterized protein LOC119822338 [Arvicola amphibius]|uniref:uncharacterized protein LOC119822338 n=1 Tax=Arvicola amphibius TaxID=1047088 RepID=UPI0018E3188F|nr:uncharacterized protein LOC119822338 [Arvicola amphibius]